MSRFIEDLSGRRPAVDGGDRSAQLHIVGQLLALAGFESVHPTGQRSQQLNDLVLAGWRLGAGAGSGGVWLLGNRLVGSLSPANQRLRLRGAKAGAGRMGPVRLARSWMARSCWSRLL
jgi:hypothetical protein